MVASRNRCSAAFLRTSDSVAALRARAAAAAFVLLVRSIPGDSSATNAPATPSTTSVPTVAITFARRVPTVFVRRET
jgi:hypothetical protein